MLKKELLEKIKDIAEDADVDETIQAIDGLTKPFDVTRATVDDYKNMLENNPTIKGYYQSSFDSAVGTAVTKHDEKFKKEKLPKIIEDELNKANNKNKTPEQIEAEKTLAEAKKLQAELAHEKSVNKYTKILTDKKLPAELAEFVVGKDDETSDKNVEFFNGLFGKKTEEDLKDNAPKPPAESAGKVDADTQALMNVMGIADNSAQTE